MNAMTLISAPQLGPTSGSDSNGRASNSAQSTALASERLAPGRQAFEPLGEPVPEQEIAVSLDTVSGEEEEFAQRPDGMGEVLAVHLPGFQRRRPLLDDLQRVLGELRRRQGGVHPARQIGECRLLAPRASRPAPREAPASPPLADKRGERRCPRRAGRAFSPVSRPTAAGTPAGATRRWARATRMRGGPTTRLGARHEGAGSEDRRQTRFKGRRDQASCSDPYDWRGQVAPTALVRKFRGQAAPGLAGLAVIHQRWPERAAPASASRGRPSAGTGYLVSRPFGPNAIASSIRKRAPQHACSASQRPALSACAATAHGFR